jgi:hypothetical protein
MRRAEHAGMSSDGQIAVHIAAATGVLPKYNEDKAAEPATDAVTLACHRLGDLHARALHSARATM